MRTGILLIILILSSVIVVAQTKIDDDFIINCMWHKVSEYPNMALRKVEGNYHSYTHLGTKGSSWAGFEMVSDVIFVTQYDGTIDTYVYTFSAKDVLGVWSSMKRRYGSYTTEDHELATWYCWLGVHVTACISIGENEDDYFSLIVQTRR